MHLFLFKPLIYLCKFIIAFVYTVRILLLLNELITIITNFLLGTLHRILLCGKHLIDRQFSQDRIEELREELSRGFHVNRIGCVEKQSRILVEEGQYSIG